MKLLNQQTRLAPLAHMGTTNWGALTKCQLSFDLMVFDSIVFIMNSEQDYKSMQKRTSLPNTINILGKVFLPNTKVFKDYTTSGLYSHIT